MKRADGRAAAQARNCAIETDFVKTADGSCLITVGNTKVICTASIEEGVPPFLRDSGQGWVTAEYAMLPASTGVRKKRDLLKQDGRGVEIQRLIGRSLRQAVDLKQLGPRTITLDCDVLQADGGTRTAAISGGWVALVDALRSRAAQGAGPRPEDCLLGQVAAVSVGLIDGEVIVDLDYAHDSTALVDMNVVKRDDAIVEVQGTGERGVFDRAQLDALLDAADTGIQEIYRVQRLALGM